MKDYKEAVSNQQSAFSPEDFLVFGNAEILRLAPGRFAQNDNLRAAGECYGT